jgi:divalent metal cation (Fe/Co/Zn/Cd) transporter
MKIMRAELNSLTQTAPGLDAHRHNIYWLQAVTLCWMIVECGVALVSAESAHSPALLAFGADSFIELLSAAIVLLQFTRRISLTPTQAARMAGILLFILAATIVVISLGTLLKGVQPETSCAGIGITLAALVVMPLLAWGKRKAALSTNNRALAADAVQSATCAYLAATTLLGLALNALWHFSWADPIAALAAIPILIVEGKRSLKGETCGCDGVC